jgi:hypothetical protein
MPRARCWRGSGLNAWHINVHQNDVGLERSRDADRLSACAPLVASPPPMTLAHKKVYTTLVWFILREKELQPCL